MLCKDLILCAELKCRMFLKHVSHDISIDKGNSFLQVLKLQDVEPHSKIFQKLEEVFAEYKDKFDNNYEDRLIVQATFAMMEFNMLESWEVNAAQARKMNDCTRIEARRAAERFTMFFAYVLHAGVFNDVVLAVAMGKLRDIENINDRAERMKFWQDEISNTTLVVFCKLMRHCLDGEAFMKPSEGQTYIRKYLARFADDIFRFQVARPKVRTWALMNILYFTQIMSGRRVCEEWWLTRGMFEYIEYAKAVFG